ncbi:insulinase family protein [Kitasatospora sp. HPMI-4]|uniref:insulinase family protein n=1 Tax=Kitasatospora sp. HPMI-4 TaxID=3448443 RepID=UPI003F1BAB72
MSLNRFTLPNGLRVVLAPEPGAPRVAVAVHYRVGFRSEPPGREGFAHLFEHLMFRGSENLPEGRFFDEVHALGGLANGTTHQDYTDYYQSVPAAALEQALFREADRMRAPRFTPEALAFQLDGIESEIRQAVTERPYGGFPWPLLPGVLFDSFASTHDGYGRIEDLRRITVEDCAAFFDTHYAPGNAVLTVTGGYHPDHARLLIERHFGGIPARPVPAGPGLDEPLPTADRRMTCSEPGVPATALAIAHRLPDPATALPEYLAHTVLAALLGRRGAAGGALPLSAGCGFFGPLDAKDPDALVVTSLLPGAFTPDAALAALQERLSEWSEARAVAPDVAETVPGLAMELHREHSDLLSRCRALGRLEALFGRADLLDELPSLIGRLDPEQVAGAARALRRAHHAVLVLEPGPVRTRPEPVHGTGQAPAHTAPHPETARPAPGPAGPGSMPPLGPWPKVRRPQLSDSTTGRGLRVVAVADRRAPLIEFRLRTVPGPAAWDHRDDLDLLARRLTAHSRTALPQGELRVSAEGEWLDFRGYAPTAGTDAWLAALGSVLRGRGAAGREPARSPGRPRPATPAHRMDEALRLRRLAALAGPGGPAAPLPLDELHRRAVVPTRAVFVAVGDLDPDLFPARVAEALSGWEGADGGPHHRAAPWGAEGSLTVPAPDLPDLHLTWCGPEPAGDAGDPARFLATAVLGGYYRSRLASRCAGINRPGLDLYSGRDLFTGTERSYVRARVPEGLHRAAVTAVRDELRRMAVDPPSAAEVDAARNFCAGQLLGVLDSPSSLADLLYRSIAAGREPEWVTRMPGLLLATAPAAVAEAGAGLFAGCLRTTVALGAAVPEDVARPLGDWPAGGPPGR